MDISVFLGAPLESFRVVYRFKGELSEDVADDSASKALGWTQRHNPFLGGTGPPTFLQGWEEWHALMFESSLQDTDFTPEILYAVSNAAPGPPLGIIFVIETAFTTAPAYLRAMACELGLATTSLAEFGVSYGEFTLQGFSNTEKYICGVTAESAFSVCLLKLAPSEFSVEKAYDCCDGHRIVSYLAKAVKRDGAAAIEQHAPSFFLKPLSSPMQAASHMSFHELDYGRYYRKIMRTPVSRLVRSALKSLSVPLPCSPGSFSSHLQRNEIVNIFRALRTDARVLFFSCNNSQRRVAKFYRVWLECDWGTACGVGCDINAWARSLQQLFYTAVSFDLSESLSERFSFSFRSPEACACAEKKILLRTTALACRLSCKRAVDGILSAVLNKLGCSFALPLIQAFGERRLSYENDADFIWRGKMQGYDPRSAFDGALSDFLTWNHGTAETALVIRNLQRMQICGSRDSRIPVSFSVCIACNDSDAPALTATRCWKLLKAGANPCVLLKGIVRGVEHVDAQQEFAAICFFVEKWLSGEPEKDVDMCSELFRHISKLGESWQLSKPVLDFCGIRATHRSAFSPTD